jgi:hypothetical protein
MHRCNKLSIHTKPDYLGEKKKSENTSGIVIDCNKIKSSEKTREQEIDDALNAECNWLQDVKEGRAKKIGFRLR